jgi:hypothetical protein
MSNYFLKTKKYEDHLELFKNILTIAATIITMITNLHALISN